MKIAFITNRPAYYRVPIFERIAGRHDVEFFFTARKNGRWWTELHQTMHAPTSSKIGVRPVELYRRLAGGGYDCVVCGLGGRSHLLAIALAVRRRRIPLVLWVDMWHYPRSLIHLAGRPLAKRLIRGADAFVSCGPHVTRYIKDEAPTHSPIIEMVNAVDNDHFARKADPAHVRRFRNMVAEGAWVVGFVGRVEAEKGFDVLMRALPLLPPDVHVMVAGTGSEAAGALEVAKEQGVSERIVSVGWLTQSDLPSFYASCDCVVIPSRSTRLVRETWGLVANEAMAAGVPVVASETVGAAAGGLIVNEVTGLVVKEGDAKALAEAVLRLKSDTASASRLVAGARSAVSRYTFDEAALAFSRALSVAGADDPAAHPAKTI